MLGIFETGFLANISFHPSIHPSIHPPPPPPPTPTVTQRIFKKLRRYFPDPLGIRESFCEIAARHKRVKEEMQLTPTWWVYRECVAAAKIKFLKFILGYMRLPLIPFSFIYYQMDLQSERTQ